MTTGVAADAYAGAVRPDPLRPPTDELLIALDVDGTILHHDGHLSPRVAEAVRECDRAGARVVIATGRPIAATLPILAQLGLDTEGRYAVCSNGAITITVDPGSPEGFQLVEAVTFDPRPAVELLTAELPAAMIAVETAGVGFKASAPFPAGELTGQIHVVGFDELVSEPATRVTFRDPNGTSEDFIDLVERIGLHGVNYAVGYTAWLDLTPEGVSKMSALEQVRRRLRVEPSCTVAVGDQRNDLEMLRWAADGVAMGQAPAEVAAAADRVTGPVEEDGLAQVLEGILAGRDAADCAG